MSRVLQCRLQHLFICITITRLSRSSYSGGTWYMGLYGHVFFWVYEILKFWEVLNIGYLNNFKFHSYATSWSNRENLNVVLIHGNPIIWKHLEREIIPLKVGSTLYEKWSSAFICRIIISHFQSFNPKQLDPTFATFKHDSFTYLLADFCSKKWSTSYAKWS